MEPWLLPMLHPKFHRDDSILLPLVGMLGRMNSVIHRNQIEALINRQEADSVLTNIKCKTLIVVGREDAWSPVEQHQRMHERISGSRLEVIPEAGHFAPFEQPFAVNQVLNAWLQDLNRTRSNVLPIVHVEMKEGHQGAKSIHCEKRYSSHGRQHWMQSRTSHGSHSRGVAIRFGCGRDHRG